ncbi:LysR family transcriptional regulator [Burkholderia ubonensis]|uniref:pca operon transcription factor PcaQ n=1 Tax=Burkholderia ubonensis TaxID=101571 RepID=UPI00075BEB1B|nr:pca operon transcription factor PcaQ [Burkholderia ubonensis]KVD25466.1 LysR family transcriptional regulator [Burkholderia ubonensis]KVQ17496.1 LysR family transcriptional regulator [Burkholderia ubonensis]KVU14636.1 LysR family transcriptional regulator [Burkholderia ubonensis]KVU70108.1 LysR family transcriptional regulator [Burkholderia ubonensis]KVU83819.1 LysR family transcriptional regulator [Burkholderia ubonensis]
MTNRIADGRVKFRHLQCFLAVAQLGGVQKAAESLSITQPAVSKTIAELESILGVRLFERSRQGARPTREAQLFMPHANACVLALRQGVGLLAHDGGGAAATLEIGMLPTVAASLAPALMKALAVRWPRVVVRLATAANAELLERLKAGAIECAIGRLSEPERMVGLAFEQLYNEPLVAVVRAGHPLMASVAPAAELARYPVVLPPYGTLIRQSAEQLLGACGAPPLDAFIEVLSVSVARALALENDAVWFVPQYAAEYDLSTGALARLPLPSAGTDEPVGLILRTDAEPSPVARTLIDAVREIARARFGDGRPGEASPRGRRRTRGDKATE